MDANKCESLRCDRHEPGQTCKDVDKCDMYEECPDCYTPMEWQEFDKVWICEECGANN